MCDHGPVPRVVILPSPFDLPGGRGEVAATVPAGEALRDVCDDLRAAVPFACRDARCGTCLVEIVQGAGSLSALGDDEALVLSTLGRAEGSRPRYRLACRVILEGDEDVVLRTSPLRG